MTETIAFLDPLSETTAGKLARLLPPGFAIRRVTSHDLAERLALIAEADYAVSADVAVDAAMFRAAPRLKLLHKWGVGIDNFDLGAARTLGIKVARTTGSNAIAVAEFTIGLMLATQRRIAQGHAGLQQGRWLKNVIATESVMFSGKTVGIVGLGAIGRNVARMAAGFGCRVVYTKPVRIDSADEQAIGAEHLSLPDFLAQADIVSLNCPLTAETRGMIARPQFDAMRRSAILVNVSRGGVVVEQDLVWALQNRVIRAAATDVFETEPVSPDNPLLHMDNVVTTPHCAAVATDNFDRNVSRIFRNIQCVANGEPVPPLDVVVG